VIRIEINLPDEDGLLLLAALREAAEVPIFVCSATSPKRDAALSLKLGADEFMHKPLNVDEFEIRLERTLCGAYWYPASSAGATGLTRVGNLAVDHAGHEFRVRGKPLALTPTEFRLLEALVRHPGQSSRTPHCRSCCGVTPRERLSHAGHQHAHAPSPRQAQSNRNTWSIAFIAFTVWRLAACCDAASSSAGSSCRVYQC
jgi:CheY-like chemotaxis protein